MLHMSTTTPATAREVVEAAYAVMKPMARSPSARICCTSTPRSPRAPTMRGNPPWISSGPVQCPASVCRL